MLLSDYLGDGVGDDFGIGMRGNPAFRMAASDDLFKGTSFGKASQRFIFRPRTGRINWRLLNSLDLDRVIREGDVDTIQAHMDNITYARFGREDLEVSSDEAIVKVVQLSQLCIEFLGSMCSSSQHLVQGLVERLRVQSAQLKAMELPASRRHHRKDSSSRRPGRRPSREVVSQPEAGRRGASATAPRKCPHCPKRFQSE